MGTTGSLSCPACGAEFDVQERLDERSVPQREPTEAETKPPAAAEPVSFQCPACGADYETDERLADEPAHDGR